MAENKKSFVLYSDLIFVVEKIVLKDRENKTNYAGELFLHILQYVNDKEPIPIDFIVEMAFEPIKLQLKRDLVKYEQIREKRAQSGKAGGLKSGEIRSKTAQKENKESKTKQNEANALKTQANEAVNDNVNVNVNVNDILLEKETKYDDDVENFPKDEFSEEKEKAKHFLKTAKPVMIERMRMQHKLSVEHYNEKVDEFVDKKFDWGENSKWKNEDDMVKNFEFWLPSNYKRVVNPYKQWTQEEFKQDCAKHIKTFGKDVLNKFYNHFRQRTPEGEMLFQTKKAWNTEAQLKNWCNENLKKQNSYAN